jgi:hypothetical protein
MNVFLLSKWVLKLERGDDDLCCTLLRKKYLKGRDFFSIILEEHHNFGKVSYPVFIPKPSTHRMHDPGSIVPHIWSKSVHR